jgi:hypothetical protein
MLPVSSKTVGETEMNRQQEKILVATLCGVIIAGASAFAVQPAMASGHCVDQFARVMGVAQSDALNVRNAQDTTGWVNPRYLSVLRDRDI